MKNFIASGDRVTLTANRALNSGDGFLLGQLFGVANDDVANAASGEFEIRGIFDLTKDTSTFSVGDKVYWDDTAHKCTSTATSNKYIGAAVQAQVTGDTTVRVRLNPTTVI